MLWEQVWNVFKQNPKALQRQEQLQKNQNKYKQFEK